jgi:DNA-binding transcriptional MerR regulator
MSNNLTWRDVQCISVAVTPEPTLAELAAASGLLPRTIRSWVAQGLLPGPLTRGPAARYPAETLTRLLAIRAMRDVLGMPLAAIRQELLAATPEQVAAHAARATGLAPERAEPPPPPAPADALDYLRSVRLRAAPEASPAPPPPPQGFAALEGQLGAGRNATASRRARAEDWTRIPVTPDVELAIRGRLDAESRATLERCADLIRDILLGRDR